MPRWQEAPPVEQAQPRWMQAPPVGGAQPEQAPPRSRTESVMRKLGLVSDPEQPTYRGPLQEAVGLGETALQLGTGAVASSVGGLAGIAGALLPGPEGQGAAWTRGTQEALTYQPRGDVGRRTSEAIARPLQAVERGADWLGEVSGESGDTLGATAVKTAVLGAPALLGLRRGQQPQLNARQRTFQQGRDRGYVAPPSSVSNATGVQAIEGLGGKLKTQQMASVRNQAVTNQLAVKALGLPDGTEISPAVLSQVRASTQPVYSAIRGLGPVQLGKKYLVAIENAVSRYRNTQQQLPQLGNKSLLDLADDMKKPTLDSATMVDAIQILRDKSSAAYAAGDKGLGKSYRSMVNALESGIDDHLASTGGSQSLLTEFRDARQLIAKTYTVENALVGGDVSATVLARQLGRGKPLSGELRGIAEFAQEFPKATRVMKESVPMYSPLDAGYQMGSAAAALATGSPALLGPMAYSLGRPFIRNYLLSNAGQRAAIPQPQMNAMAVGAAGSANALTNRQ